MPRGSRALTAAFPSTLFRLMKSWWSHNTHCRCCGIAIPIHNARELH